MLFPLQLLKPSPTRNRTKLAQRSTAFNHGKATGNMTEYKQCSYSLRKAIKQAKRQYRDKVESQLNGSDTRGMWQGLQSITDYKKKTSPVADTDVLLPDKLNHFFARFEDNTVPLTRPATKTCGLSFTSANMSKTFKRVYPRKAAGPDSIPSRVLRACTDQLAGVFTVIFNQSLSQSAVPTCFKRATIVPIPKKAKVTELNIKFADYSGRLDYQDGLQGGGEGPWVCGVRKITSHSTSAKQRR